MNYIKFSNAIKGLFHLIDIRNYKVAQQQIHKILIEDKQYKVCSYEYIKLLHIQSILQFNDRNFEDAEISLQNAMLQAKYSDEGLYNTYATLYNLLISYTNTSEIHWKNTQKQKKDPLLAQEAEAVILQCRALGSMFQSPDAKENAIKLLRESTELFPSLAFQNSFNITAILYLFENSNNKNQLIEESLIESYIQLKELSEGISNFDEIITQYQQQDLLDLNQDDFRFLLLFSQYLISSNRTKQGLQSLNICNQIIHSTGGLKTFLAEVHFIYAAYFFDQMNYESCVKICDAILETEFHPVLDQLKLNALILKSKCQITKPLTVLQNPPSKAFRQPKQQPTSTNIEKEKAELQKKYNLRPNFRYFYQFDSGLKELFNIKNLEIEIKEQLLTM